MNSKTIALLVAAASSLLVSFQNCSKISAQDNTTEIASASEFEGLNYQNLSADSIQVAKDISGLFHNEPKPVVSSHDSQQRLLLLAEYSFGMIACLHNVSNQIPLPEPCVIDYSKMVRKIVIFGSEKAGASAIVYRGLYGENKEIIGKINGRLVQALTANINNLPASEGLTNLDPESVPCADAPSSRYYAYQKIGDAKEEKVLIKDYSNCIRKELGSASLLIEILSGWEGMSRIMSAN